MSIENTKMIIFKAFLSILETCLFCTCNIWDENLYFKYDTSWNCSFTKEVLSVIELIGKEVKSDYGGFD